MFKSRPIRFLLFMLPILWVNNCLAHEGHTPSSVSRLLDMKLEELKNITVTSVSKSTESQFRAASAITILTSNDIKRSGATHIVEALRMVPGMNVAQISPSQWAVSARGFNRQFSNKLLVLIDGRSVYTPLFSGVYWDIQDIPLEDIDRIEVIRGPGAALWGANAVNGVVNVITKHSSFTQGTHVSTIRGNHEKENITFRYGGNTESGVTYRVYGKHINKDEYTKPIDGTGSNNQWRQHKVGFRVDSSGIFNKQFTIQGEFHEGRAQQEFIFPGLLGASQSGIVDGDENYSGGHLLTKWQHIEDGKQETKLQFYLDFVERDMSNLMDQERLTVDFDLQKSYVFNKENKFIWGANYRLFKDDIDDITASNGQKYLSYVPSDSYNSLYSLFGEHRYSGIDNWEFILGTKISHNYFTDFEFQPNVRISWALKDNQTLWFKTARAIRIPTRGERSLSSIAQSDSAGFVRLSASADRNFDSEKLTAFELGYRAQPSWWFKVDASVFYNIYDDLRTFENGSSDFNSPNTFREFIAENLGHAETYGLEASLNFNVTKDWEIQTNYSFLELEMHTDKRSADFTIASEEDKSPEQQLSVLSRFNLSKKIEIDNSLYLVDELSSFDIDSYARFDTRFAWRPSNNVEISAVAQNIFDKNHGEFTPFLFSGASDVGRSAYLRLDINF
jgi:iron complex outermembrane receptor protein